MPSRPPACSSFRCCSGAAAQRFIHRLLSHAVHLRFCHGILACLSGTSAACPAGLRCSSLCSHGSMYIACNKPDPHAWVDEVACSHAGAQKQAKLMLVLKHELQVEELLTCWQSLSPCNLPLGPYCNPDDLIAAATSACQHAVAAAQLPDQGPDPQSAGVAVSSLLALGVQDAAAPRWQRLTQAGAQACSCSCLCTACRCAELLMSCADVSDNPRSASAA